MQFIDIDVRGKDPSMAEFSKKLGWSGSCFISESAGGAGIEVCGKSGEEIKKKAETARRQADLVIGYSDSAEMSRSILESKVVDVLRQSPSLGFSPLLAKLSKENNIALEFRFSDVLHSQRRTRSIVMGNYLEAARLARKFGSGFVLATGAETKWDIRSPSDMMSFGRLLGFQDPEIIRSMSGHILKENKKRLSEKWVMPGIEVE